MVEIAVWQDAELPFSLEYARPVFERIRQRAAEGLTALPRVGMGVGGLLLGERTAAGVRVTGTVELPCSHTLGPTFQLTPDETRQSMELAKGAGSQRTVVGIYCTRTRGVVSLGTTDRELVDLLCPEPWQIALALRPAAGEPTRAAVFFRRDGELVQGTVRELWEWRKPELDEEPVMAEEPRATPPAPIVIPMPPPPPAPVVSSPVAESAGAAVPPAPTVIEMPRPVAPPRAEPQTPRAEPAPPRAEPQLPRRTTVHPQFVVDPPRPAPPQPSFTENLFGIPAGMVGKKTPVRLVVLAAGILLGALLAILLATKDSWLPRPPLALNSSDTNGLLEIRWNAGAARGLDHASLLINDGGELDTVTLDSLKLLAGSFLYKRKTDRVTVTLDLGKERARTAFPLDPPGAGTTGAASAAPVLAEPAAPGAPTPAAPAPSFGASTPSILPPEAPPTASRPGVTIPAPTTTIPVPLEPNALPAVPGR